MQRGPWLLAFGSWVRSKPKAKPNQNPRRRYGDHHGGLAARRHWEEFGNWVIEKRRQKKRSSRYLRILMKQNSALIFCLLSLSLASAGAELSQKTVGAFDKYVAATESRINTELRPGGTFLY